MVKSRENLKRVVKGIQGEVHFNEPLSRHTSLKIGGPADVLVVPATVSMLQELVVRCRTAKIPVFVLGGTNLLVRDGGIRGLVIKLSHLNTIRRQGKSGVVAEGGVLMPRISRFASDASLTGLEFGLGIPGTVGGAVVMNAGVREGVVAGVLSGIRIMVMDGTIREIPRRDLEFGYRWSRIPRGIIVSASFQLKKGRKETIDKAMHKFLQHRKDTQPLRFPNAGSVFKNPNGGFAAQVIESLGLKGCREGDAQVSEQHSNFIVNQGRATAREVMKLIRIIGRKVEEEAGITLELELKIVGQEK